MHSKPTQVQERQMRQQGAIRGRQERLRRLLRRAWSRDMCPVPGSSLTPTALRWDIALS